MKSLHFYVNGKKPRGESVRDKLTAEATRLGIAVTDGADADVVVALGGDGTILRAVHEFPGVPVLGLNIGGLGFLSCVAEHDFAAAISLLAEGRYRVSERTMLEVCGRGDASSRALALNDIVIVREMSGHAAVLDLAVDGRAATRYLADGLVVATPTGSTAYSLSAGGPVLMPDSRSFVVTPMCPHALAIRPMVTGDGAVFEVTARVRNSGGRAEKVGVYADGEPVMMLGADETVRICRSAQGARLVELEGHDPYGVLARKLGWSV